MQAIIKKAPMPILVILACNALIGCGEAKRFIQEINRTNSTLERTTEIIEATAQGGAAEQVNHVTGRFFGHLNYQVLRIQALAMEHLVTLGGLLLVFSAPLFWFEKYRGRNIILSLLASLMGVTGTGMIITGLNQSKRPEITKHFGADFIDKKTKTIVLQGKNLNQCKIKSWYLNPTVSEGKRLVDCVCNQGGSERTLYFNKESGPLPGDKKLVLEIPGNPVYEIPVCRSEEKTSEATCISGNIKTTYQSNIAYCSQIKIEIWDEGSKVWEHEVPKESYEKWDKGISLPFQIQLPKGIPCVAPQARMALNQEKAAYNIYWKSEVEISMMAGAEILAKFSQTNFELNNFKSLSSEAAITRVR